MHFIEMVKTAFKFIEVTRKSGNNYKVAYWKLDSGVAGPSVLVTGAMHGNEIQSPEIIRCFKEDAEKNLKAGSCILIPFVNPVAVGERQAHIDFETGRLYSRDMINNLNCSWPGKADGSDTERLSYAIFNSGILEETSHFIDLHCWQSMMASTVQYRGDNPVCAAMAKASRLPFIEYKPKVKSKEKPEFPCILSDYFNDSKRSGITIEFSGQFLIHHYVIKHGIQALNNIFKYLDMIDGEFEGQESSIIINEYQWVNVKAPIDGLFVKAGWKLGEKVRKGDFLGHIFCEKDLRKYSITAPENGWIFRYARQQNSLLCVDPLSAYHVYANKGEIITTLIV